MAKDDVVKKVIDEAGYSGSDILSRANSADIKAELRARTQEAKDVGLCGVPTYRVFRRKTDGDQWQQVGDIVWGQDEIAVVEDLIAGWNGETGVAKVADANDVYDKARL